MTNVFKLLAKSILIPLGLKAAADARIHLKTSQFGTVTLIISIEKIDDIMNIVKSLKEFGLSIKGASETTKNEAKEQKGGFLSMLLGTLGASLLENLVTGKREDSFLMLPHSLTNFEIQRYFQSKPKFNDDYS